MKDKEKQIEIKHGSENMVDLLNQEQAELQKAMVKEMAKVMCGNDCEECAKESADFYGQTLEEARNNHCLLKDCAKTLYNAGYQKVGKDSVVQPTVQSYSTHDNDLVVLSREEYKKYKSGIWLTPEEYQKYHRFLVEWNCGEIKRVKQNNSKNEIVHLARRKNEANGYIVNKDKLIYFSNMFNGYEYEYKDLQEVCNEMNALLKRFDSYEEQLTFWKGKAKQYHKETAEKIIERAKSCGDNFYIKICEILEDLGLK